MPGRGRKKQDVHWMNDECWRLFHGITAWWQWTSSRFNWPPITVAIKWNRLTSASARVLDLYYWLCGTYTSSVAQTQSNMLHTQSSLDARWARLRWNACLVWRRTRSHTQSERAVRCYVSLREFIFIFRVDPEKWAKRKKKMEWRFGWLACVCVAVWASTTYNWYMAARISCYTIIWLRSRSHRCHRVSYGDGGGGDDVPSWDWLLLRSPTDINNNSGFYGNNNG